MRVDGHTDVRPIVTAQFRSNWELSVVARDFRRAVSDQQGRLAAAPGGRRLWRIPAARSPRATEAAYSRNRRIELKLTER